jgi:hypothetical protein
LASIDNIGSRPCKWPPPAAFFSNGPQASLGDFAGMPAQAAAMTYCQGLLLDLSPNVSGSPQARTLKHSSLHTAFFFTPN